MTRQPLTLITGLGTFVLLAGLLGAVDGLTAVRTPQGAKPQPVKLGSDTTSDAAILGYLDLANRTDIEGGMLAQKKASDPKVKHYADRMVADHEAMLKKGGVTARRLQLEPRQDDDSGVLYMEHRKHMEMLRDANGRSFDRAYIEHEITAHRDVLDKIDKSRAQATNPAVKAFLEQARPVIEQHLDQAKALFDSMSG